MALAALAIAAPLAAPAVGAGKAKVSISVLSGRADLVSDDDALIEIRVRGAGQVKVTVDPRKGRERAVTGAFRHRGHRLVGLLTGLDLGRNVVRATLPDGSGAPPGR